MNLLFVNFWASYNVRHNLVRTLLFNNVHLFYFTVNNSGHICESYNKNAQQNHLFLNFYNRPP